VHEAIRHGAAGVLTETDESMGAEAYMLRRVRGPETAREFVALLDRFRAKLAWHGLTPESNPSAGNRFRGLYNIALKSLGAVHKKDPRTRLDTVIEYAQPLREIADPGFTFMNGPGNDLEGIAGQVGAGCNLILFVTGNGSITNFPVRADAEDHDHHPPAPVADPRDGHQRRSLPRRRADGGGGGGRV
jgi:altronate dehydratase